jgi:hypothetical protein
MLNTTIHPCRSYNIRIRFHVQAPTDAPASCTLQAASSTELVPWHEAEVEDGVGRGGGDQCGPREPASHGRESQQEPEEEAGEGLAGVGAAAGAPPHG